MIAKRISDDLCPICKVKEHSHLYSLEAGKLVRCCGCHLTFYLPRPTSTSLENYYNSPAYAEDYRFSSMAGSEFSEHRYRQFEGVIEQYVPNLMLPGSQDLLDVGCGEGDFLAIAESKGWQVAGIELSNAAAKQAQEKVNGEIYVGEITAIDLPKTQYDLITSYHVIEHLIDPVLMLQHIYALLRPGGVVLLETPNIDSLGARIKGKKWSHIIPPEHINYFDPYTLRHALQKTGFQTVYTYTIIPHIIHSIDNFPPGLKQLARKIYEIAPYFNLGASLQAIAVK